MFESLYPDTKGMAEAVIHFFIPYCELSHNILADLGDTSKQDGYESDAHKGANGRERYLKRCRPDAEQTVRTDSQPSTEQRGEGCKHEHMA